MSKTPENEPDTFKQHLAAITDVIQDRLDIGQQTRHMSVVFSRLEPYEYYAYLTYRGKRDMYFGTRIQHGVVVVDYGYCD